MKYKPVLKTCKAVRETMKIPCIVCVLILLGLATILPIMASSKSRVIVLTDISNEPDDAMSTVRFLNYSNEFDVEGLIAVTSVWLKTTVRPDQIRTIINAYGLVRNNLLLHAPGFPATDTLLAKVKSGLPVLGMLGVGTGKDSEGSNWIISVVDKIDTRPVWISVWGGPNCLAQALWKVKSTRTIAQVDSFVAKLRVYATSDQDSSAYWIRTNFPNLFYIVSPGEASTYKNATWAGFSGDRWYGVQGADSTLVSNAWVDRNVQINHGPLGAVYPDIKYCMEGDTPTWLYLFPSGLVVPEMPQFGSWGGRYTKQGKIYTNATDKVIGIDGKTYQTNYATIWRWRTAYQNDFQARMDWNVSSFANANHPPRVILNGIQGIDPVYMSVKADSTIILNASGSSDTDNNILSYKWYVYPEAGTYGKDVPVNNASAPLASIKIPLDAAGKTIHVILEVTDNGFPVLTRYRRACIEIQSITQVVEKHFTSNERSNIRPVINTFGNISQTCTHAFTLDGRKIVSSTSLRSGTNCRLKQPIVQMGTSKD
jgi:hypothetical protein